MAFPFLALAVLALNAMLMVAAGPVSASDAVSLPDLPLADCGLLKARAPFWRVNHRLDEAARSWALGKNLSEAVALSGYTASAVSGLRFYGLDAPDRPGLNEASCRVLRNRSLSDAGSFRRADELWVVFAAQAALPDTGDAGAMAQRAVSLVNKAREQGHPCGNRPRPRANPVKISATLSEVALEHARDMARHHYFDHQDLSGHSPADRVRAAGYREQRVAENIAYGALSTEDAVAGWLNSPGHCENLMDPGFKEMGIAFAPASGEHRVRELYWAQLFAEPK